MEKPYKKRVSVVQFERHATPRTFEEAKEVFTRGTVVHVNGTPEEYNLGVATGNVEATGTGYVQFEMRWPKDRTSWVDASVYSPSTLANFPEEIDEIILELGSDT